MAGRELRDELRDAVSLRTVGLVAGVLLLQLAFIASYIGAFHHPSPHGISLGVVAPGSQATAITDQLDNLDGDPLDPKVVSDAASARRQVTHGDLTAALIVSSASASASSKDTLVVASGGGTSLTAAVEQILTAVEGRQHRTLVVEDVVPLQSGDGRGLSGFYLVIGWLVGGYLVASLLGVAKGARPTSRRRAAIRLAATVPYAVLSGLGGVLIVDQGFGALTGHFWSLWGLGTLVVLSAATVTMAFQVLYGSIGIGLTILLFVVLGNPSAGGAYQTEMLPGLWRTIGPLLPNGAGTDAVRQVVYFGGDVASQLLIIAGYAAIGAAVTAFAARENLGLRR